MKEDLALDLRVSRRRAGLSGSDLAHLLGCTQERISKLENARARISEDEFLILGLVYADVVAWPERMLQTILPVLKERLAEMPDEPTQWAHAHELRLETLNSLTSRLQNLISPHYETS